MSKFVIHKHLCDTTHLDLMFEKDDFLETWQIELPDMTKLLSGKKVPCKKIQNHRKAYLTIQGEISGNRGFTEIFDSGEYYEDIIEDKEIVYNIKGKLFAGIFKITYISDNSTKIEYK